MYSGCTGWSLLQGPPHRSSHGRNGGLPGVTPPPPPQLPALSFSKGVYLLVRFSNWLESHFIEWGFYDDANDLPKVSHVVEDEDDEDGDHPHRVSHVGGQPLHLLTGGSRLHQKLDAPKLSPKMSTNISTKNIHQKQMGTNISQKKCKKWATQFWNVLNYFHQTGPRIFWIE